MFQLQTLKNSKKTVRSVRVIEEQSETTSEKSKSWAGLLKWSPGVRHEGKSPQIEKNTWWIPGTAKFSVDFDGFYGCFLS